jgi:hypothetical protein
MKLYFKPRVGEPAFTALNPSEGKKYQFTSVNNAQEVPDSFAEILLKGGAPLSTSKPILKAIEYIPVEEKLEKEPTLKPIKKIGR